MIQLTRIRLINWHNFHDVIIEFKSITYLIGVNAVGKTTILDALRYCLTTNKNFNNAGNRRSKRTLQGSVHDKQREQNVYLRPGHTVSYIGTEFKNTENNASFVIIARVESESPNVELHHILQDWYISRPGARLEDINFLDAQKNTPTNKTQFESIGAKLDHAKTQKDAKNRICLALGIGKEDSPLGKKFNEVFHMGTSLNEIEDIRTFIYAYILPEPEMNIETLLTDMRELEHLQDVLGQAMKRADLLEQIKNLCNTAQEKEDAVQVNEGVILLAEQQYAIDTENNCLQTLEQANRELEYIEKELIQVKEKRAIAQEALNEAIRTEDENPENKALKYLREREEESKKEYNFLIKKMVKLQTIEKSLVVLFQDLSSIHLDIPNSLLPEKLRQRPKQEQIQGLYELEKAFRELKSSLHDILIQLLREKEDYKSQRERLEAEIRKLNSGKWFYPDGNRAEIICDAINQELLSHGYEADARILCDLLYMTDVSWQDATEACLGARRFDILVAPNHYFVAKQAFMSLKESVGNVCLIDTPSLQRDSKNWKAPCADELAYQISSENANARTYVSYLLHGYHCCESADTLEQYSRSVTRDLLRHQSYRLERLIKPERYIGQHAKKERLKALEMQYNKLLQQQKQCEERSIRINATFESYLSFISGSNFDDIRDCWDSPTKCVKLENDLESFRKEIKEYEQSPLLQGIFNRKKRCQQDFETIDKEHDKLVGQKSIWEEKSKDAELNKFTFAQKVEQAKHKYTSFCESCPILEEDMQTKYAELSKTRASAEIIHNQTNYRNQLINARNAFLVNEVIPKQREYNHTYGCDYPEGLEGAETFRSLYNTLYNVDLEKYAEDLRQAQIRCKERFRKDILFRMKDDIAQAKRQIRELENVMKDLAYGEETYHFVLEKSKDPELSAFCSIILDESNRQINEFDGMDAYIASQDKAYEAQVEELMQRIMSDVEADSEARLAGEKSNATSLSKYVDYRTYLDYDIRIENSVTKGSAYLSQVSGDSSGGENQAPYYVAICASLLQIYKHSDNSIRLLLLDEAFNRMTSDRIWPMMRMFQEMHMQVILVSTAEKCTAIQPACDITYSIVKSGARNAIRPFIKETL